MSEEITEDAVDTMIMLDMEVRKKIREEIIGMIRNPQTDEERQFSASLLTEIREAEMNRQKDMMRQMEQMKAQAYQRQLQEHLYKQDLYQRDHMLDAYGKTSEQDNSSAPGSFLGSIGGKIWPF